MSKQSELTRIKRVINFYYKRGINSEPSGCKDFRISLHFARSFDKKTVRAGLIL